MDKKLIIIIFALVFLFVFLNNSQALMRSKGSLHRAAQDGDLYKVQELIKAGQDVNALDEFMGLTPLHLAVSSGHHIDNMGYFDVVKLLVESGADVNKKGWDGDTPLFSAVYSNLEIVRYLAGHGADVHIKNRDGDTLLHRAVSSRKPEIARFFIQQGVDVHARQKHRGWTALHIVAYDGNVPVVEELVEAGADVNGPDNGGETPLHLAVNYGNARIVKDLILAGAIDDGGARISAIMPMTDSFVKKNRTDLKDYEG